MATGSREHFAAETVWVRAVKEGPDDDHAHTALFQASDTPSSGAMNDKDAASRHPGGTNFLFGDGPARFLKDSISLSVHQALSTRAGNEAIRAASYRANRRGREDQS